MVLCDAAVEGNQAPSRQLVKLSLSLNHADVRGRLPLLMLPFFIEIQTRLTAVP